MSGFLDALNGATTDDSPPIEALATLSAATGAAEARAQRTRDVVETLGRLVRVMSKGEALGRESWLLGLDELLLDALGNDFRERLDNPAIRKALFGGNELRRLDLRTRTLVWHDDSGVVQRPLEAFSTGEQAFAFTQARILGLEELPADQDRLLVLDEFGAFVAADRLAELASFLAADDVQKRASQVLVILPLQANYEAERDETTGWLRDRYDDRLRQLNESGYIAERFSLGSHGGAV